MVFLFLVVAAIGLYVLDYKIPALMIFFFFVTSGFNLIPEEVMENILFSKGIDYAILIIVGIVIIDSLCIKNYLKPDKLIWVILVFYAFLAICVIYNRFVVGTGWTEIIRTARYNVLWIAYLVFRNLPKERLLYLLKCLFIVTVICATLYILQIMLDTHILNKTEKGGAWILGIAVPRFYNQPDMLQIFTFMAIYFNPYKRKIKIITTTLLIMALLGAFHRSLVIAFIAAISIGYVVRLPRVKRVVILSSFAILSLFFVAFFGYKFANSRTVNDIANVASGNIAAIDIEEVDVDEIFESTFSFRIVHLMERNLYLLENPKAMLFGAGLMTEDSKLTNSMFNFNVGLTDRLSGSTVQLDTADISYSILLLRYGYLGTFIILLLYVFLMGYFYKNRENPVALFSFVYFIVLAICSFFSHGLVLPISFLLPLITYSVVQKSKYEK